MGLEKGHTDEAWVCCDMICLWGRSREVIMWNKGGLVLDREFVIGKLMGLIIAVLGVVVASHGKF